nr:hypothetical protein [Tanacetum cinerariifolium]
MELYMQNREHGRMILESVEHGPLICLMIEENGLPLDVYSLVNHHRVAKDLWERVELLMQGKSLHRYYLRFTQLIDDMNVYKMKLEQFQVNTKFLNSLPPEWSMFVTDVKLVSDFHTTNFDQLHAYLEQHELHANEICLMLKRNQVPLALVANHQMTPSTLINIHTTILSSNNYFHHPSQQRVVKCFNYQGEGHMARQCPKPKRKRDATWFRDKVLLVEAQGSAYQVDDLDAYDSDYDDFSTAKAVLMANLSSYKSDVLSK